MWFIRTCRFTITLKDYLTKQKLILCSKHPLLNVLLLTDLNLKLVLMSITDVHILPLTQPSGHVVQVDAAPKLCSVGERPQVEPVTGGSQRPQGLMVESPSQYQEVKHL